MSDIHTHTVKPTIEEPFVRPAAAAELCLDMFFRKRGLIASSWLFQAELASFVNPYLFFFCFVIQASALDALLDDSVMFAKKLRDMGQPVSLKVVEDLPHGFLSLAQLSRETEVASDICVKQIRKVFLKDCVAPALQQHANLEDTYMSSNSPRWLNSVGSLEVKRKTWHYAVKTKQNGAINSCTNSWGSGLKWGKLRSCTLYVYCTKFLQVFQPALQETTQVFIATRFSFVSSNAKKNGLTTWCARKDQQLFLPLISGPAVFTLCMKKCLCY